MYYEEYLPDDAILDDDVELSSVDSASSLDSDRIRQKLINAEYKMLDNEYYKVRFVNKMGENVKIECYSTPLLSNRPIRHAPTGIKMEHPVGSKYQDLYFIVADTTAPRNATYLMPRKLFYNSPEEFERHQRMEVSQNIKETWHRKNMVARSRFYR